MTLGEIQHVSVPFYHSFVRQEPGTDEECELFHLYERLYLTAEELGYPLPPGEKIFHLFLNN